MTTNQTIDGVPRELLERVTKPLTIHDDLADRIKARDELRALLEVTAVRVERLQDISTEQIIAEGISTTLREHDAEVDLRRQWRDLWESTGGDWDANPWVWVVEFKRVTP